MKASPIQSSFNAGEMSQLMLGRVDFERTKSAVTVCKNGIPYVQGPWTRRPGFYMCDEVKDSTRPTRTVRFKFATGQSYAIEFGHFYVRFKKSRAPVYDLTSPITNITNGAPAILTYTGADPANGDDMDISGLLGPLAVLNGLRVRVTNVNAGSNTFEMYRLDGTPLNTSSLSAYTSGGNAKRVYTVVTPYNSADIFQLKFSRSVDKIYVFHVNYPEASLNRFADANWTHTPLVFLDGPYLPMNTTLTTLTPSAFAPGAGVTLTASSAVGINDGLGFQNPGDIGRYIRIQQGTTWGYCLITGFTSNVIVTVTIINSLVSVAAKANWRMGLLSAYTGYSACGTFFDDRFVVGGCPYRPSRFDMTKTGDYLNFAETATDGTVTDASAVSRSLNSEDVQSIRWMKGTSNGIAVGTLEGEWLITPSALNEAVTPTNVNAKQSTGYGSANMEPVQVGAAVIFVQVFSRRLREMSYQYYENNLQSPDITLVAEHITKGPSAATSGFVELAYQKERIPVIWGPRVDGVLLGVTFSREEKTIGWHRHNVGGFSNAAKTLGALVKSCCAIPADDGSYEELWIVSQRYIGGRVVQFNEFLTNIWERGNDQVDAFYVDAGLSYRGVPTLTLTGLHHLAGETVQVLVNGATHPDVVVSEFGVVTLNSAALLLPTLTVHVGYTYQSDGQTLRPEAGAADGTSQGKTQRSHAVTFRLLDTLGLKVGPSFEKLKQLTFRQASDPTGAAVPLFTGDFGSEKYSWNGDYTKENVICWRVEQPVPATILAVMPRLSTEDP